MGGVEIQTHMKHALLWELHAITVENQTTAPKKMFLKKSQKPAGRGSRSNRPTGKREDSARKPKRRILGPQMKAMTAPQIVMMNATCNT